MPRAKLYHAKMLRTKLPCDNAEDKTVPCENAENKTIPRENAEDKTV